MRLVAGAAAALLATSIGVLLAVGPAAGSGSTTVATTFPPLRWHHPVATLDPQHLVVLGDSVPAAAGCGCTGFAPMLARDAALRSGRTSRLLNAATAGLTASALADALAAPPTALRAALSDATAVTVTIGANDLDGSRAGTSCGGDRNLDCYAGDLASLRDSLRRVLTGVHALAPRAQVLVTGYWNVFLDGSVGAQQGGTYVRTSDALTRQVNTSLAAATQSVGATYVDLYAAFKPDADPDDTALLAPDGDHPSDTGHRLIATTIERAAGWRS